MIIDGPYTFDLTLGSDRRVPSPGDAQTEVPATVLPVVLGIKPTRLSNGGGILVLGGESEFAEVSISVTNSAATNTVIVILPAGLWELEATLATQFDYASPVGGLNGVDLELFDATSGLIMRFLTRFAAVGSFVDFNRNRLLLKRQLSLRVGFGATTVAQHIDSRASVNCIRIL